MAAIEVVDHRIVYENPLQRPVRLHGFGYGAAGLIPSRRRRAPQQALSAQVFIDGRPVDPEAATCDPPIGAFISSGIQEPWVPSQGYADRSYIDEINDQIVFGETNIANGLTRLGWVILIPRLQ